MGSCGILEYLQISVAEIVSSLNSLIKVIYDDKKIKGFLLEDSAAKTHTRDGKFSFHSILFYSFFRKKSCSGIRCVPCTASPL